MDWECPKCGLINMPGARFCDCGYDTVARQVDRHKAPKHAPSTGWFATYQLIRFGFGGVACGIIGISLLLWELSEGEPSFWGVVRSALISFFGFGLVGILIWLGSRSS